MVRCDICSKEFENEDQKTYIIDCCVCKKCALKFDDTKWLGERLHATHKQLEEHLAVRRRLEQHEALLEERYLYVIRCKRARH